MATRRRPELYEVQSAGRSTVRTTSTAQPSAVQSLALPVALSASRPKKLRFALFNLAGKIASHAGNLTLRISEATDPNCTKSSLLDEVQ